MPNHVSVKLSLIPSWVLAMWTHLSLYRKLWEQRKGPLFDCRHQQEKQLVLTGTNKVPGTILRDTLHVIQHSHRKEAEDSTDIKASNGPRQPSSRTHTLNHYAIPPPTGGSDFYSEKDNVTPVSTGHLWSEQSNVSTPWSPNLSFSCPPSQFSGAAWLSLLPSLQYVSVAPQQLLLGPFAAITRIIKMCTQILVIPTRKDVSTLSF